MNSTTKSPEETEQLAPKILSEMGEKRILLLTGELGSGKTTFVRGLTKALGITQLVKSPTFTYLNIYNINADSALFPLLVGTGQRRGSTWLPRLFHFDLYRLPENTHHFPELEESIENPQNLIVIEWSERLKTPPEPALAITFTRNNNGTHIIEY